jgi:hypothetical protein
MYCQYKNIFGEPGKGVHSYRVGGFAIIDIVGTILAALFISWILDTYFVTTLVILFLLGIVLHRLFCVRTTLDTIIFS